MHGGRPLTALVTSGPASGYLRGACRGVCLLFGGLQGCRGTVRAARGRLPVAARAWPARGWHARMGCCFSLRPPWQQLPPSFPLLLQNQLIRIMNHLKFIPEALHEGVDCGFREVTARVAGEGTL